MPDREVWLAGVQSGSTPSGVACNAPADAGAAPDVPLGRRNDRGYAFRRAPPAYPFPRCDWLAREGRLFERLWASSSAG